MAKEKTSPSPLTLEEALTQINGLTEKNTNQEATIIEQAELIDELSTKVEKLEGKAASGNNAPSVTIKGRTYSVVAAVKHLGQNLTPAEVAQNEALCKELLANDGQTILIEEEA
jgi:hypothetical protein